VQIGRDGDVLVITLVERPSISEINIEGNKAIKTEDLFERPQGAPGLQWGRCSSVPRSSRCGSSCSAST
jgi:hypothetical protein